MQRCDSSRSHLVDSRAADPAEAGDTGNGANVERKKFGHGFVGFPAEMRREQKAIPDGRE